MESEAAHEYSKKMNVSYAPCGLVIHPDAPWLGSSPDGLVYDPHNKVPFGLCEFKCPNVKSYIDCQYLELCGDDLVLKKQHPYHWQVQGQLLITGMQWCDFVTYAQDDMLVERICRDEEIMAQIRVKADYFFFYVYMNKYLSSKR